LNVISDEERRVAEVGGEDVRMTYIRPDPSDRTQISLESDMATEYSFSDVEVWIACGISKTGWNCVSRLVWCYQRLLRRIE